MMKKMTIITVMILVGLSSVSFAAENAVTAATKTAAATVAEATVPMREINIEDTFDQCCEELSDTFFLHPMQVNLLNGETAATLDVPERANVKMVLYDRLGREVLTLHDGQLNEGRHTFVFREYRLPIETFYLRVTYQSEDEFVNQRVFL